MSRLFDDGTGRIGVPVPFRYAGHRPGTGAGSPNGHTTGQYQVPGQEPPRTGTDARARPLTRLETMAAVVIAATVGLLGVIGLANSFAAVQAAARDTFSSMAWTVPVAIDLGLAGFAALDLLLARLDMRPRWLRLVPWTLIGVTIYLNVAEQSSLFGVIAHAALPGLWIVAVEVGIHAVRVRAGLASGRRLDSIRASRWLLAPFPTLLLWRRMVLWEIRSYPNALARERDRLLARTGLQDTYGRIAWRWRVPRRARALYRLGELVPDSSADVTGNQSGGTGNPALPAGVTGTDQTRYRWPGTIYTSGTACLGRIPARGNRRYRRPVPVTGDTRPPRAADVTGETGGVTAELSGSGTPNPPHPNGASTNPARPGGDDREAVQVILALDAEAGQPVGVRRIRQTLRCGTPRASRLRKLADQHRTGETSGQETAGQQ